MQVTGIPAGATLPPTATLELIDSTHAYAKPVWEAAGRPVYPNATEIAAEMAAAQLVPEALPITVGSGSVTFTVSLEVFAVARVTFEYEVA